MQRASYKEARTKTIRLPPALSPLSLTPHPAAPPFPHPMRRRKSKRRGRSVRVVCVVRGFLRDSAPWRLCVKRNQRSSAVGSTSPRPSPQRGEGVSIEIIKSPRSASAFASFGGTSRRRSLFFRHDPHPAAPPSPAPASEGRYVTTTGNCDVITLDHILKMKDKEPDGKFRRALFSGKRPDGEARRGRIPFMGLRLRSNEARRSFARKPSGRRVFCPWPALARSSQPAAGMLRPRRLVHSQNPSPQRPS